MTNEYKKKIHGLLMEIHGEILNQNSADQMKTYQFIEFYFQDSKKALNNEIYREFIN